MNIMYSVVRNNMLQIVLTGLLLLHVEMIVKFVHEAGKLCIRISCACAVCLAAVVFI